MNCSDQYPLHTVTYRNLQVPVVLEPVAVKQEYKIEDDYAVYGTVNDIDIQVQYHLTFRNNQVD